jgi:nitronate monooxygenase
VGSFGFAYSSQEKIRQDLRAAAALTQGLVNANFFVFSEVAMPEPAIQEAAVTALRALPMTDGLDLGLPSPPFFPDLNSLLEPVWEHPPSLLSFHFGIPAPEVIQKAQRLGMAVGVSATNPEEALAITEAGADFIVAQGIEAGGHRGSFDPLAVNDTGRSVDALLLEIRSVTSLPLVAAGGLMNGSDIRRVLDLGAAAAQLGTAFLLCDESGASPAHKRYVLNMSGRGVAHTRAFSGRLAQGIRNEFIDSMAGQTTLPFPIQNLLTAGMRQKALATDNGEYQNLWAGRNYARARKMPAADLMRVLGEELSLRS